MFNPLEIGETGINKRLFKNLRRPHKNSQVHEIFGRFDVSIVEFNKDLDRIRLMHFEAIFMHLVKVLLLKERTKHQAGTNMTFYINRFTIKPTVC